MELSHSLWPDKKNKYRPSAAAFTDVSNSTAPAWEREEDVRIPGGLSEDSEVAASDRRATVNKPAIEAMQIVPWHRLGRLTRGCKD